jgi:hypothetical protein
MANGMPHTDADNGNYDMQFCLQLRGKRWYILWHASEAIRPASDPEVAMWRNLPSAVRAMATTIGKETRSGIA